jgi:hypothetical protein
MSRDVETPCLDGGTRTGASITAPREQSREQDEPRRPEDGGGYPAPPDPSPADCLVRIRQVKPAFWSDSRLAELPEATRLFYVGLWMIADDAGWFRWDAVEVSRDLYGYEGRARRERRTTRMFEALVESRRIVLYPCGHAEVPKLADHQHLAGISKQVRTAFNEHLKGCVSRSPAATREDPRIPESPRPVKVREGQVMEGNGTVSNGQSTAHAPDGARLDEPTPFQQRVPRPPKVAARV